MSFLKNTCINKLKLENRKNRKNRKNEIEIYILGHNFLFKFSNLISCK